MKTLFLALALCFAGSCYAEDFPSPVDGKPVQPEVRQVYADVCHGASQPVWCAEARNDANLQGSTGGSGDSSSSE